jgi:hypothetical protein
MTASLSRYVLVLVSTPNPHGAHMPLDDGANARSPASMAQACSHCGSLPTIGTPARDAIAATNRNAYSH